MTNSYGYDGSSFSEQIIDLIVLFIILSLFFDHSRFGRLFSGE